MYVAKGNSFLSDFSLREIEMKYLQENNAKAKIRLQCAVLRKKGKSIPFIGDVVGKRESTISDILRRFEKRSITGCYAIKQKGQPHKLTIAERLKLKKVLSKSPQDNGLPFVIWTTKLVTFFIKNKFRKELVGRQVHRIISSFNMSIQKPSRNISRQTKNCRQNLKKTSTKN